MLIEMATTAYSKTHAPIARALPFKVNPNARLIGLRMSFGISLAEEGASGCFELFMRTFLKSEVKWVEFILDPLHILNKSLG